MSNYLEHLVSRNLGHTDQVRPRLPSLFESSPDISGLRGELAVEVDSEIFPVSEPPDWNAPRVPLAQVQPSTGTEVLKSRSGQLPLSPPSSPDREPAAPVLPTAARTIFPESLSQLVRPLPMTPLNAAPAIQPQVIEHWVESTISSQPAASPAIRSIEVASEQGGQKRPPTVTEIAPTIAASAPVAPAQAALPIRPAALKASTVSPLFPLIRSSERQAINEPKLVPSAPTIHVTIGRIEVRATPLPVSVQPKSRPATPMLSLDDYLRQRGGGK